MDLYEYPLLHEADLMLAILRVGAQGGGTIDHCREYLLTVLKHAREDPPIDQEELQARLEDCRLKLAQARLVESRGERFEITPRGREVLAANPGGVDETVLMQFEEFRAALGGADAPARVEQPVPPEYAAGYVAFGAGRALTENPHPRDTRQHLDWQNGWSQARDRRVEGQG